MSYDGCEPETSRLKVRYPACLAILVESRQYQKITINKTGICRYLLRRLISTLAYISWYCMFEEMFSLQIPTTLQIMCSRL